MGRETSGKLPVTPFVIEYDSTFSVDLFLFTFETAVHGPEAANEDGNMYV